MDNPDNLNADGLARAAFDEMDYNNDNTITKAEFMKACMGNDKLITSLAYKMLDVCLIDCQ